MLYSIWQNSLIHLYHTLETHQFTVFTIPLLHISVDNRAFQSLCTSYQQLFYHYPQKIAEILCYIVFQAYFKCEQIKTRFYSVDKCKKMLFCV